MASSTDSSLSTRGTKRKVLAEANNETKRARRTPSPHDSSPSSAVVDGSGEATQPEHNGRFIQAPLSPVSAKPSPKFPSRLKTLECPHEGCEKSFNRPVRLEEHLRSHTNSRIFVCPHEGCGKDFLRDTHLKHHVKSAHSDLREYACKYEGCGKSFVTNTRLKRHLAAHEGREKFMCKECGQSFRKHGTLQKHELTVHEGKAAYVCEEIGKNGQPCGAGFDTASKLRSHRGRNHGSEQYQCSICEQSQSFGDVKFRFATYSDLQEHNSTVHPPTCTECGLQCSSARELRQHFEINHEPSTEQLPLSERRTHHCPGPGCGKSFTKHGNLSVHVKQIHCGKKQFVCGEIEPSKLNNVHNWDGKDACGRGFTAKATLEEHVRTSHLGLPHSRKGKPRGDLKGTSYHKPSAMELVIGGQQYDPNRNIRCLVAGCDFLFTREYDLDVHLRARHGLHDLDIHRLHVAPATDDYEDYDMDDAEDDENMFLQQDGPEDQFWMGGIAGPSKDEWFPELNEMRVSIDGDDEVDDMAIDPSLRC